MPGVICVYSILPDFVLHLQEWFHVTGRFLKMIYLIVFQQMVGFMSLVFFLSGFCFTNILDSLDSRDRGRLSLELLYHFHPLHRHTGISWTITAERTPLHIASSQNRICNLWIGLELLVALVSPYNFDRKCFTVLA